MTAPAILYAGDWNAQPWRTEPYRPKWVAAHAGLTLMTAGRGSHGDIDYPMSDAVLAHLDRHGRYGSDHQLVTFTVRRGVQLLRGGTWNCLHKRDPVAVAAAIVRIFEDHDLDFLCIQEAKGYRRAIRLRGFNLTPRLASKGSDETAVVTPHDIRTDHGTVWRLARFGFSLWPRPIIHAPPYAAVTTVDGWLRVASVHLPNFLRSADHNRASAQAGRRLVRRARRIRARA